VTARVPAPSQPAAAGPAAQSELRVWLHFDGTRAHLRVLLRRNGQSREATLSAPSGNAEDPAAAVDRRGDAAVAFTEWRDGEQLLRVATNTGSGWHVATLDRDRLPIWSPRVAVTPRGTTLSSRVAERGQGRALRAAVLPDVRHPRTTVTLDHGDGLGAVVLASGHGDLAVAAWTGSRASETRVRAGIYTDGSWQPVATLASSLAHLGTVRVAGPDAGAVRWSQWTSSRRALRQATRSGLSWRAGILAHSRAVTPAGGHT
jgi:hypothetical protein